MKVINVWTCSSLLLLLYAQFAVGIIAELAGLVVWSQCPTNCSCTGDNASLVVDCHGRQDVPSGSLSDEIESMLSSNPTYIRLSSLSIANSALTQVPRSICRLTTLRKLYLYQNRLSRMPGCLCQLTTLTHLHLGSNRLSRLSDNCLANLSNLQIFNASDNAIEILQNGVFDGLRKLEVLDLSRNRISAIGLSVFTTSSNLTSLYGIYLSKNNLTSLEPWIFDRSIVGTFDRPVVISLSYNQISTFANEMGLHNVCGGKIPYIQMDLRNNGIYNIMDIFNGWQLNAKQLYGCYRITQGKVNVNILFDQNIPCDCINYHFYRLFALQVKLPIDWGLKSNCSLFDPVKKKSSIVNAFNVDLSLFVCELTARCPAECVCAHRPKNDSVLVYCSNKNLAILPFELPELPDSRAKYKLDFSNNKLLRRLEHRDYFVNTSILDVSDSSVEDVSDWEEIVKIPTINLFGNKISSLPLTLLAANITTEKLNMANNSWDCSCDNRWMSEFFNSIENRLTQKVLCYSPPRLRGKDITQISEEEFCVDPATEAASQAVKKTLTISTSSVGGVVAALLSVVFVVYRLRVKLYTRFKFHPFDRDECRGEDMNYDAFLSCSTDDNLPHGNRIRELLEQHGYRVCYPPRDFVAGNPIYENIYNAVVRSRRTVCLVTEHFCQRFVPCYRLRCVSDFSSLSYSISCAL